MRQPPDRSPDRNPGSLDHGCCHDPTPPLVDPRRAVPEPVRHRRRQHHRQRRAADASAASSAPAPASSSGSSTPTRSCSPACCSPRAAWATASAARVPCSWAWSPFAVCSVLAGLAQTPEQLIAARAAMGIGAALIFPATLAILTNVFTDPSERAKAIGAWAGVTGLAVALGPVTGGWILEHFAWGAIFLVNLPIAAVALLLGRALVPTSRDPHAPRLDPVGLVLSIVGVVSLVWADHRSAVPRLDVADHPRRLRAGRGRPRRLHPLGAAQHATRCSTCRCSPTPGSPPPASRSPSGSSPCSASSS